MEYYKALANLIEAATDSSNNQIEEKLFSDVADMIRSRSDMPKQASQIFQKRLTTKNQIQLNKCLQLLDYCTFACEVNFHGQIAAKDFLLKLGSLLNQKDIDQEIKNKILCLISLWNQKFQKDLHPMFFQFQDGVRNKGFEIPQSYQSPYSGVKKASENVSNAFSYQDSNNQAFVQLSNNQNQNSNFNVDPKYQKLKSELDIIKSNIFTVNEVIDAHETDKPVESNDILRDLIKTIQNMDPQLQQLISQLTDEQMLKYSIDLLEDLHKTLERYNVLKRGLKPPPLKVDSKEDQMINKFSEFSNQARQKVQQTLSQQKPQIQATQKPQPQQPSLQQQTQQQQQQQQSQSQQQGNQQTVQQQQQQPPQQKSQQQTENLLDLIDDGPSQKQSSSQNKPQFNLLDINLMDNPGTTNTTNNNQQTAQPVQQQIQQNTQPNLQQNIQNKQPNSNIQDLLQKQQQQIKYSALDQLNMNQVPQQNWNMMQTSPFPNQVQMNFQQPYQMQPMNLNQPFRPNIPMQQQVPTFNMTQSYTIPMNQTNYQQIQQQQQPPKINPINNNVTNVSNNNQVPSWEKLDQKKQPFDDLDDMFGIDTKNMNQANNKNPQNNQKTEDLL